MIAFCSDLDNTLIYSHRRSIPEPKHPAEYLDGRVISYITERTLRFFSEQKSVELIPVTTRTEVQYRRIGIFQEQIPCRYALVCNGAVLLENGVVQKDWLEETLRLGEAGFAEIERLRTWMASSAFRDHMHYAEPGILYFVPEETASVEQQLLACADPETVMVCVNGRKVYCIPKMLTKGVAVRRLRERLHPEKLIAAGDSTMDVPMLDEADIVLCAEEIASLVRVENKVVPGGVLSDEICAYIEKMMAGR